jgi:hypothetical protein
MAKDWQVIHLFLDDFPVVLQSRMMLHGDYLHAWENMKTKLNNPKTTMDELRKWQRDYESKLVWDSNTTETTIYMEIQRLPGKALEKLILADIRPEDKELKSVLIFELDDMKLRTHMVHWLHKEKINGKYETNSIRHTVNKVRDLYNLIADKLPFVKCVDYKDRVPLPKSK